MYTYMKKCTQKKSKINPQVNLNYFIHLMEFKIKEKFNKIYFIKIILITIQHKYEFYLAIYYYHRGH